MKNKTQERMKSYSGIVQVTNKTTKTIEAIAKINVRMRKNIAAHFFFNGFFSIKHCETCKSEKTASITGNHFTVCLKIDNTTHKSAAICNKATAIRTPIVFNMI